MRNHHTALLRLLAALLLTATLAGCGAVEKVKELVTGEEEYPDTNLDSIAVVAEAHANQDSSTRLDIVFVYDEKAIAMVPKTAVEWFREREALLRKLPRKMEAVSLQIPPAYILEEVELPKNHDDAISVTVFANYLAKQGLIPIDITPMEDVLLTLQPQGIEVVDTSNR